MFRDFSSRLFARTPPGSTGTRTVLISSPVFPSSVTLLWLPCISRVPTTGVLLAAIGVTPLSTCSDSVTSLLSAHGSRSITIRMTPLPSGMWTSAQLPAASLLPPPLLPLYVCFPLLQPPWYRPHTHPTTHHT